MRVLYVVTAFPRWPGDLITPWLLETISRLAAVGIQIEVLAPAYEGMKSHTSHGVRVHRFRYAPSKWETLTHDQTTPDRIREKPIYLSLVPPYLVAGSIAAARLGRSGRFDLVHAFWPVPHAILGTAAKFGGRIPLVSTFFGVEFAWSRAQLAVVRPVLRGIVHLSDSVTAISSYTAAKLQSVVPSAQPILVPFGATVEAPTEVPHVRSVDECEDILFVGRLVERKGVNVLLNAVHRLRAHRKVRLRIVGDGPLRTALEAQVQDLDVADLVEFHGFVTDEELSRFYRMSDVFVLPAIVDAKGDTEGLGVVLIEALVHGCPVIASRVGGIPDIVLHEQTGLLVPGGDSEALANALLRYIDDRALASRLAESGRQHVERHFSWRAITTKLQNLYEDLLDRGHHRTR